MLNDIIDNLTDDISNDIIDDITDDMQSLWHCPIEFVDLTLFDTVHISISSHLCGITLLKTSRDPQF